ncbi:MAG: CARDB domain-containing protein [Solirubrobacteraceae bacterium]
MAMTLAGLAAPAARAARRADLVVSTLTVAATARPGDALTAAVAVKNRGRAKVKKSQTGFLLSTDRKRGGGNDIALSRAPVRSLGKRRRAVRRLSLSLPASASTGKQYLIACADIRSKVREANERNNCRAAHLTVEARAPPFGGVQPSPLTMAPPSAAHGSGPGPGPGPGSTPTPTPGPTSTPTPAPTATPTPTPVPGSNQPTPLDPGGGVTSLADASAFLYKGAGAAQQGADPDAVSPARIAVLRGRVSDVAGEPIGGVRVTVLHHPEYGHTDTRADGGFDLVVNGARLDLVYTKAGFLPVQRQLDAPWQDYFTADEVVMTPLDDKVTTVDHGSSTPFQVAEGSPPPNGGRPRRCCSEPATTRRWSCRTGRRRPSATSTCGSPSTPAACQRGCPGRCRATSARPTRRSSRSTRRSPRARRACASPSRSSTTRRTSSARRSAGPSRPPPTTATAASGSRSTTAA